FLFFRGEVQLDAANHLSLRIGELERRRRLPIVILRDVKENCQPEWRVIAGIGWPSKVGVRKTVNMCQPGLLRSEQETGIGLHGGVLGQLLENSEIIEHPERTPVCGRNHLALARVDRDVAHLRDWQVQRERLPVRARVETEIDGAACAEE